MMRKAGLLLITLFALLGLMPGYETQARTTDVTRERYQSVRANVSKPPCKALDFNYSFSIDAGDIQQMLPYWRKTKDDPNWATISKFDLVPDDIINVMDFMTLASRYSESCIMGPFGVQVFGEIADASQWSTSAPLISEAGMQWVRIYMEWLYGEPNAPVNGVHSYRWDAYDILIARAIKAGLLPLVIVQGNPNWAVQQAGGNSGIRPCGPMDPQRSADFVAFVAAAIERYNGDGVNDAPITLGVKPVVKDWEMGNEPDFDYDHPNGETAPGACFGHGNVPSWGLTAPQIYGKLLHDIYVAVNSSGKNSGVSLWFGSVAYDRFTSPTIPAWYTAAYGPVGPFNYNFINNVLDYLYAQYGSDSRFPFVDGWIIHNYNDFTPEWNGGGGATSSRTPPPYNQEILGKIKHIRDNKLYKPGVYDLRTMPFASSEVGLLSAPTDQWTNRSDDIQSMYVPIVYARSIAAGMKFAIWFQLRDYPPSVTYYGYGILKNDFSPKPVLTAFKSLSQKLGGVIYDRQLTPGETGDSQIEAFRFNKPDGGKIIVAWRNNGARMGAKDVPPVTPVNMLFTSALFGNQTGQLLVTDHMGVPQPLLPLGSLISIGQAPKYIEVVP